jgi:uncharacterized protein
MRYVTTLAFACLLLSSVSAQAASYDCDQARTSDEIAICKNRELNDLDVKMATMFEIAKGFVLMGQRGAMQDDQREWLADRRECGARVACLKRSYRKRIGELEEVLQDIRERGRY